MNKNIYRLLILFYAITAFSCTTVRPYQRAYLNDPEMKVGYTESGQFENYFQSIREGNTSASFGKSAEGCGCK